MRHNPVFAGSFLVPFSFIEHLASERVSHAFLCPSQFTFSSFVKYSSPDPCFDSINRTSKPIITKTCSSIQPRPITCSSCFLALFTLCFAYSSISRLALGIRLHSAPCYVQHRTIHSLKFIFMILELHRPSRVRVQSTIALIHYISI